MSALPGMRLPKVTHINLLLAKHGVTKKAFMRKLGHLMKIYWSGLLISK